MTSGGKWWARGALAGLFARLLVIGAVALPAFPGMTPASDEEPVEANGNAQSDALVDCYAKFQGPDLKTDVLGPPRITRTKDAQYVLRADFRRKNNDGGVDRLMCWPGGFVTQKDLPLAPLYPGAAEADAATQSAVTGWRIRKQAVQTAAMTAKRFPPPDSATVNELQGIWLVGQQPDKGDCIANWYGYHTQIEFEFVKSGGRAVVFEPPDLFTPIKIAGIEKSGDILSLQAGARDGGLHPFMRFRSKSAGQLEILASESSPANAPSQVAYKCGGANISVTQNISVERLSLIAPPLTGGTTLIEKMPTVSDTDLCEGRGLSGAEALKLHTLQFELYGPVHYWLLGMHSFPQHKFGFDFVRSVEDRGDKGLVLHMQQHIDEGNGWDVPKSRGEIYDLTVIPRGENEVEITELSTAFVRCRPTDKLGVGAHRW